jgi:hypothetical protein
MGKIGLVMVTAILASMSVSASARDGNFQQKCGDYGDLHVRYPGDSKIPQGNIRTDGRDKGAYIERCSWSFNPDFGKGFGLTQRCRRYTIKNTQ